MKLSALYSLPLGLTLLALCQMQASAQPPCKGSNKNDPGCPGVEEPPPPPAGLPIVSSATVDWANERVILRGTDLDTAASFTLGAGTTLTPGTISGTEVELLFDDQLAGEVSVGGTYSLQVDGADAIALYFISSVIDPDAGGCPCALDWSSNLGSLWGADVSVCYEISGTGVADLAGTVYTDPDDASVYPLYPIGAAFYADDPVDSTCRLTRVNNTENFLQDLVNLRINATQQAQCASVLQTNICAETNPGPEAPVIP